MIINQTMTSLQSDINTTYLDDITTIHQQIQSLLLAIDVTEDIDVNNINNTLDIFNGNFTQDIFQSSLLYYQI